MIGLCVTLLRHLFVIITVSIIAILAYYKWSFNYWKKQGCPYLKPSFPFGTVENYMSKTIPLGFRMKNIYTNAKSLGHKHIGIYNFWSPVYMPIHPEYVKNIIQKDFNNFVDRGIYYNEKDDPLSAHLLAIGGTKWKVLREKLTHTFTSNKMKMMFKTVVDCSYPMKKAMDELAEQRKAIDIKDIVACFATDVIGSVAFGLNCNSFQKEESKFRKYGKKVFQKTWIDAFKFIIFFASPKLGKLLRIRMIPKDTSNFFMNVVRQTINYRKNNNFKRNDMLQLLINVMNNSSNDNIEKQIENGLTFEEIAAQAYIFFLAGFDTTSNTMQLAMFEMGKNQLIQGTARNEINEILNKHNGQITYEGLSDMKYLDQVINETLRLYPIAPILTRQCVKEYGIPETGIIIKKGTSVAVPALGLHYDPEYFVNPEKFEPDRFSEKNKKHILPFTFFPFGEGPRKCIGMRFALMQMKIGFVVLLQNYKFTLNRNTVTPLQISPFAFSIRPKDTIWLNIEKIT